MPLFETWALTSISYVYCHVNFEVFSPSCAPAISHHTQGGFQIGIPQNFHSFRNNN